MNSPDVYIDENNSRMMMNIRNNFNRLAEALIREGKNDSAIAVLDRCRELVPHKIVPYDYFSIMMAESYFKAGAAGKGAEIIRLMNSMYTQDMDYYLSLNAKFEKIVDEEIQRVLYFMREMNTICMQNDQNDLAKEIMDGFNKYLKQYSSYN
jgi:hypothetical protein